MVKALLRNLKIYQKLWVLTTFIILLISSGFYFYFTSKIKDQFIEGFENKAMSLVQTVAANLGSGLFYNDNQFLRNILSGLENDPDVSFIYVADKNDSIRYGYRHHSNMKLILSILNSNSINIYSPDFFIFKQSIFYHDEYQGNIVVGFSLNWVKKNISDQTRHLLFISLSLTILLIIISYILARAISKPFKDAAETINKYSEKTDILKLRLPVKGKDEFSQLAQSLNQLAESLEKNIKELNNSKKYLETLFQLGPIPIVIADTMGQIEGANESASHFFEIEVEVLKKMNLDRFFQQDDLNAIYNRIIQDSQEIRGYVTTIKMIDGTKKVVELNISSHQDEYDYIKNIIIAIIDITEKIQIQREILINQSKLQRINAELGQKTKEAQRLSAWNKRNAYNLSRLIHSSQQMMRANQPKEIMKEMIINGMDLLEADECAIYFWDSKTKKLIPSMTSPEQMLNRLIPATGEEKNFLWETYKKNESFVRNSDELIITDYHILGLPEGKLFTLVSVPISEKDYRFGIILFIKYGKKAFRVEDVHLLSTLANQAAILLDNMHLVQAIKEKAASLEKAYSDLQKSQQQVIQLQKMESLGTLVGGIAHDFNNILGIIIPNTDLLRNDVNGSAKMLRRINIIAEAAQRAADLTRQLLMFSRNQDIHVKVLSPNEFITHLAGMFKRTLGKEYEILLDLDPKVSDIEADENRLTQILINLAVNARDAMPNGGQILIRTRMKKYKPRSTKADLPEEEYVCISMTDTGCGIQEDALDKIFDPFFTTKSVGKGTGLGLSVVYGLMQSHKGYIDVESKVGVGTTFYLYFPPSKKKVQKIVVETRGPIPHGTETILIVDDEKMIRNSVQEILQSFGYNVFTAASGYEAIRLVKQSVKKFQLAIVDMSMPKLNGVDTIRILQKIDNSIKIILSSGHLERDQAIPSDLKIDDKLPKPYRMRELALKVRKVLNKKETTIKN